MQVNEMRVAVKYIKKKIKTIGNRFLFIFDGFFFLQSIYVPQKRIGQEMFGNLHATVMISTRLERNRAANMMPIHYKQ